jgi:sphingomyelin phosphodiesterase 2
MQAFDTAQFIRNTKGDAVLQILAGDLNTEPNDIAYRLLTSISHLQDTYNLKGIEGTHEVQDNTYTDQSLGQSNPKGIRIDYILYRARSDFECEVYEYKIGVPGKIPDLNISYSDHEAVSSTLILTKVSKSSDPNLASHTISEQLNEEEKSIYNLKKSIEICNKSLKLLESHRRSYSIMAIGVIIILFNLAEVNAPYGLKWPYIILKFSLCGLVIFFVFMASIWNTMERHGILSGKLGMEIEMERLMLEVERFN